MPLPGGKPPPKKMTFRQFLAWTDQDTWAEWVRGEVVLMAPVRVRHQAIAGFLNVLLAHWVEAHALGAVYPALTLMKLPHSAREPDLVFVSRARAHIVKETYLAGAADLAVEIVSPDSRQRDHRDKLAEYEAAGVREYWIIDPLTEQAEFHRLIRGRYRLLPVEGGVVRSAVLNGLWLEVGWFWQEPLPPLMSVLKKWKLVP
jgi:Uma2 family endonuclease